jgi:hypothetical protein
MNEEFMRRSIAGVSVLLFMFSSYSYAQSGSSILSSNQAINWSNSGVGGIPARTTNCASLTSSATLAQINSALSSCTSGETVYLAAGTYTINGTISIPSNVTLRGAGANLTILNATGTGGGSVVSLGTNQPPYSLPTISITSGATAGSTSIVVSSASGINIGTLLMIGEQNNSSYVTSSGSEGVCGWCDDGWSSTGQYARGQIVMVTGVSGTTIAISPGLYSAYTNSPLVAPFNPTVYAGVENLQVYANNTGYTDDFSMWGCAYCWIKGVEGNYTDGNWVDDDFGYHDEIRDSYFSNAFNHSPGSTDSDVDLAEKTTATLVENNIMERGHEAIMLEWGAAGNVISYNYAEGGFDPSTAGVLIGGVDFHGAHPQFNLFEGNVVPQFYQDSLWGSSSTSTDFRNWVIGTNYLCTPIAGSRVTVSCSGGIYAFQAARAMQMSYLTTNNNFVGNVVGSTQMQSLVMQYSPGSALTQTDSIEYPTAPRVYDTGAYGWTFGYGEAGDDGTGGNVSGAGCDGVVGTGINGSCHLAGTSATDFFHGNYSNITSTITWATGVTHTLPASFYLSGKPSWWGSMPYPAIGPDVTGGNGPGGHSYGNPAENCFLNVMHGTDGGAGSPYTFNANTCYGTGVTPASPIHLTGTAVQH